MESFCKDLGENTMNVIAYEKKEMISLTDK